MGTFLVRRPTRAAWEAEISCPLESAAFVRSYLFPSTWTEGELHPPLFLLSLLKGSITHDLVDLLLSVIHRLLGGLLSDQCVLELGYNRLVHLSLALVDIDHRIGNLCQNPGEL